MKEEELKKLETLLEGMSEQDTGYSELKKTIAAAKASLEAEASGDLGKIDASNKAFDEAFAALNKSDAKLATETRAVLSPVLNLISDIKDSETANEQVAQGKADLEKLDSPEGIRKYKKSDLLQQQIRNAQQDLGISHAEANTRGLKQDILDQYRKDLNAAKTGSAGQSGAYSALSQTAANRRLRGAMALQDAKTKMRAATNARLDSLAEAGIRENEADALNDRSRAALDYRRYSDASDAAGRAVAAGRLNQRTSRLGAIDSISNLINPTTMDMINRPRRNSPVGNDSAGNTSPVGNVNINPLDNINYSLEENENKFGSLNVDDYKTKLIDFNGDSDASIFDYENDMNYNYTV